MARVRPIKLHIKDGKDSSFRLIGPKGRVLSMLKWDGSVLELGDASNVEEIEQSPNEDNGGESEESLMNEDPQITGEVEITPVDSDLENEIAEGEEESTEELVEEESSDKAPPAVAEEPEPKEDTKDEDTPIADVEDVSGESETAGLITDDDLSDLLEDETSDQPTNNELEEEEDTSASPDSESDDVDEKKLKDLVT